MNASRSPQPRVELRATRGTSMSPVIYALVERGVLLRPALAVELRGSILMRLGDPYKPVRVELCEGEIEVGDCEDDDRAHDLVIDGALHDFIALIASPLTDSIFAGSSNSSISNSTINRDSSLANPAM